MGMHAQRLGNLEILDLFYGYYNPASAKAQPLTAQTLQLLQETYL